MKKTTNKQGWTLTPNEFMTREERKNLLKFCEERTILDKQSGRTTWIARYTLVDLALYSGLRVAEMAALKIGHLYLHGNDPYIIVYRGKGQKTRTVYIDLDLRKHLKEFVSYKEKTLRQSIDDEAPLFAGRNGDHSPPITLMKSFKAAIVDAGLRKELSVHSARHTYATFLYHDSGKDLRFVQKQLGHSAIAVTAIYADILPEENGKLAQTIKRD